ncbi:sulfurtransferase [Paenibacillus antarcticus]|uniref:3-mercaptopyruvate sulfurtransferase n=1 Tax=Paenibacillus antarcticus TaxID=253703 RepID=A0A168J7Q0_9BACL|nr:sulfurtransferase [Paenibacillus antarcticus]OAB40258.1 3-mercaptopyruvate sulfurtransferase [Paenibacillus antarcticus]
MTSIISKQWLLARMYETDLVIVDCRFVMGQPEAGRIAYEEEHIPGAIYFDLEKDLSNRVTEHGGRHPLPDMENFRRTLERVGINNDIRVIAYDDQGGAMASRLWWLLQYIGHSTTYVMNEGFTNWKQAGYPLTDKQPIRIPQSFTPHIQHDMVVSMEEVRTSSIEHTSLLIDSREPNRYLGLEEPIDPVAGHIPSAINRFWKDLKLDNGSWKSTIELQDHFKDIPKEQEIIVYCGSGVTACPNILGLVKSGYTRVKLYAGSWSDWISYSGNPTAMGDEEDREEAY